ncbi:MAG: ATP-dependent Clp protease ATP-binding subunit [Bacteroidaceae bacterium]|nr:ATP-dependent Clp protease ATP-binding subunit [Bacteroidaceae bacterium]
MNNQFTPRVSDIITYSKEEANRLNNSYIGPEHLLLGILREGEGKAIEVLFNLQIDLKQLKAEIESKLKDTSDAPLMHAEDINFNDVASRILKLCILEARQMKCEAVDSEHILLAIMRQKNNKVSQLLEEHQVTYDKVMEMLSLQPDAPAPRAGLGFEEDEEEEEDKHLINRPQSPNNQGGSTQQTRTAQQKKTANDTPILDNFGTDLTRAAEEGKLDPVVGREKEIERVAQILSRRKKNNPVLIGEPGVGKSAIVEGLALRIVQKKVSRILFNKRVVTLDMASVVAGTKYRGQFEERIRSIIKELQKNPDVILFIDEIHTLVGAGSAAGSMDAANMLKPALARGEIQCIGATTLDEYRKNIEKDGALERRFQKIIVEPTTPDETLQILRNIKERYEDHHNVIYTDAALEACVKLADRYITDRFFPDKAIDALDEAGSRVHLINIAAPKEIEEQEKRIDEMKNLKNEAVKLQNFELAASYRDKEKELSAQLDIMKENWENSLKQNRETVDEEQIANVVSMISGIPVQKMAQSEGMRLMGMKDDLMGKVIGQDKAIETLVKAIRRSRIGLKDPNRPIGTFMFLGPTGVGKTHLAKELAKFMFGSADALIRVDMSEYMEKFTVSRLVGAPPGYVGYEEGGLLTEKVRRKPYSIVLLDEIEKAHSDVFNILLQVLDEGHLTDTNGRTVDFKNTIVIMTSNVGTRQLKDFGKGIGFTSGQASNMKDHSQGIITKALNKQFAPEFLNRLDEIINFDQLEMDSLVKIVDIELEGLYKRVEAIGYKLVMDEEARQFLAKKGYDIQYGARPLKRAIQTYVEDALAEVILGGEIQEGNTIRGAYDKEKDAIVMTIEH